MQAHHVFRTLKWVYFAVLVAATGIGVWAAYPYVREYRTTHESPLAVNVYSHPFVSIFSDTAMGARNSSSLDNFFTQETVSAAVTEMTQRHPVPLAKDADRDAWSRDFVSDLTNSLNSYMSRHYRDSLERLEISGQAKGQVLVRIENTSQAPVEEVRVEVVGGQLFMDAPPTPKLRSLGTRAMRLPVVAPGEKVELVVLTTQEVKAGGPSPTVQVTAKGQTFPIVTHAADAPPGPSVTAIRWIASGALYVALILLGLGMKAGSVGARLAAPARIRKAAGPTVAPSITPVSVPAAPAPAPVEPGAWRRPGSP